MKNAYHKKGHGIMWKNKHNPDTHHPYLAPLSNRKQIECLYSVAYLMECINKKITEANVKWISLQLISH